MNNGQWKLSSASPALVISSGLAYLANKKPKGLSLEEVLEMIREHPGQGYYEKKVMRTVTLGEALSSGKFEDLGKEKVMYSSIDLFGQKHDREFESLSQTGGQLLKGHYKSKPRRIK